jgi:hypothetical protein
VSVNDLSGSWNGQFAYPAGRGPITPFVAEIEDRGGRLSGHIAEPNLMGSTSELLNASIAGFRDGSAIDFTKTYDGAGDAAHAVDYAGRLSDDGNEIRGVWSLADLDGSFEMVRDSPLAEPLAAHAEAEVPVEIER